MPLAFLAPQFLWLLLAIPLVILLHFIRLRRKKQEVAALFLWKRAAELAQQRRRVAPSWLLLLQLLFIMLAALALAQPSLTLAGAPDRIFVIDASASMAARDGGGSRLDQAVDEALALLGESARVAVIRAGLEATVARSLTSDHAAVREALNALVAADEHAELQRGLELARALSPGAEIHLFTDNPPPTNSAASLHLVGSSNAANLGISTFDLRGRQAFVTVVSNHPRPQEVTLELSLDGDVAARTSLLVPAAGQISASFPLPTVAGIFRASIAAPDWDALELDNEAFVAGRSLRVVLSPPADRLQDALAAVEAATPGLALRSSQRPPPANSYDVLVKTDGLPADISSLKGHYLVFEPPLTDPHYETIRDWARTDPLLRFVDLSGVRVGLPTEVTQLPPGDWQVLAQTGSLTPVLLHLQTPELELVWARFHPSQTDMVNRQAFPILIANALESFASQRRLTLGQLLPANMPIGVNGQEPQTRFATEPGIYQLGEATLTASLLSASESRLSVPPATAGTETLTEANTAGQLSKRQQVLARWLIALALLALAAEWFLWSRAPAFGWLSRRH